MKQYFVPVTITFLAVNLVWCATALHGYTSGKIMNGSDISGIYQTVSTKGR